MTDKSEARAASERIERGIERYGDGDLRGSLSEFQEALRLQPSHTRARAYLGWVEDVLAGRRGNGKGDALDEDAVRLVTEALDDEPEDSPVEGPLDTTTQHAALSEE